MAVHHPTGPVLCPTCKVGYGAWRAVPTARAEGLLRVELSRSAAVIRTSGLGASRRWRHHNIYGGCWTKRRPQPAAARVQRWICPAPVTEPPAPSQPGIPRAASYSSSVQTCRCTVIGWAARLLRRQRQCIRLAAALSSLAFVQRRHYCSESLRPGTPHAPVVAIGTKSPHPWVAMVKSSRGGRFFWPRAGRCFDRPRRQGATVEFGQDNTEARPKHDPRARRIRDVAAAATAPAKSAARQYRRSKPPQYAAPRWYRKLSREFL